MTKVEKVKKPLGFEVCTEATLTSTELDRAEKLWVKQSGLSDSERRCNS